MKADIATSQGAALQPRAARRRFREGRGHTAGWCDGYVQANLIALPANSAYDTLLFAQRNPKLCPVLDVTVRHLEPGGSVPMFVTDRAWTQGMALDESGDGDRADRTLRSSGAVYRLSANFGGCDQRGAPGSAWPLV